MKKFYQAVSVIFNPLTVLIAVYIAAIVLSFDNLADRLLWSGLVIGICFTAPALYYSYYFLHGSIDTDIKDFHKRAGLFKIAAVSFWAAYVIVLFIIEAEILARMLLVTALITVAFLCVIVLFKKELSVHLSAVAFLSFFALQYGTWKVAPFATGLIFVTALSRYKLKMHTMDEIVGAFAITAMVYAATALG